MMTLSDHIGYPGKKVKRQEEKMNKRYGFTLVELLVVIAIIAILMAITVPVISSAIDSARRAQAQTEVRSIATASVAYLNEYARFPHGSGGSDQSYGEVGRQNEELINVLRAVPGTGNPNHQNNPRRIVFLEVSDRSLDTETPATGGNFMDPWDNQYNITLDTDFDGDCNVPMYGLVENRRAVAWSFGKETAGGSDTNKHVRSWD